MAASTAEKLYPASDTIITSLNSSADNLDVIRNILLMPKRLPLTYRLSIEGSSNHPFAFFL